MHAVCGWSAELTFGVALHVHRFLAIFALQFLFVPQFLFDTNFNNVVLDDFHLFLCRGFGVLALGFIGIQLQIDSKKFLPFMTLQMIMLSSSRPFYAFLNMDVKFPEAYFPSGGCALIILAQLYLYIKDYLKPKFDAATVVKASAAFLTVFALQFLFCPQFLYDTNFSQPKVLDEWHIWICRGFGVLGLFFSALIVQLDAKAFLKYLTVFNFIFACSLPFYAQVFMAVNEPDHYVPVGGMALLVAAHAYLCYKAK
jgi:hypothetical protein